MKQTTKGRRTFLTTCALAGAAAARPLARSGRPSTMLNPLIVAYSVEWFASWDAPLYVMGGLFLIGAACWTIIDPRRPVFGAEPEPLDPSAAVAPMNAR